MYVCILECIYGLKPGYSRGDGDATVMGVQRMTGSVKGSLEGSLADKTRAPLQLYCTIP